MHKLYLLPISLILLSPGFTEEQENAFVPPEATFVAEEEHEVSSLEALTIEVDPALIKELEEEIASMIAPENQADEPESVAAQFPIEEEQVASTEETAAIPEEKSAIAEEVLSEKEPGSHVRRFATPSAIAESESLSPPTVVEQITKKETDAQIASEDALIKRQAPISKRAPLNSGMIAQNKQVAPVQSRPLSKRSPLSQSNVRQSAPESQVIADRAEPNPAQIPQSALQPKKAAPAKNPAPTYSPRTQAKAPQGKKLIPAQRKGLTKTPDVKVEAEKPSPEHFQAQAAAEPPKEIIQEQLVAQAESATPMPAPPKPMAASAQMMTNTAARPVVKKGTNIWVMGEALLWQAVEENLTFVYTGNDLNGNSERDLKTTEFDWDWGFKVGAGYNIPRDGWDVEMYWTHIHNTANGHEKASGEKKVLYPVWNTAGTVFPGTATMAKGNWQVHLEQVDLDLGREFYVGKHLTTRPFVGARSAWIFQEYDVEMKGFDDDLAPLEQEASLKNRYFGFGFLAGLNTDWKLGAGFSLYGDADLSILMGYFDVDQKGTQDDTKIWSQEKSFRTGRAIMDLGLGLKYKRLFNNDHIGLTFKAGYEYHLYFNQNQFILSSGNADFELFNPIKGDLTYQGVIGSMQIDF